MPDIGVVVALPKEMATLGVQPVRAGDSVRAGGLHVAVAGVGADSAQIAAQRLLDAGARALVSWGVAGGLAQALRPGDLVLADRVFWRGGEADVDSAWHGRLARAMRGAGLDVVVGPLWCHAAVVSSVIEKQQLAVNGCVVVDMECAGVARVARAAGVPFVVVKGICDPAARALPADAAHWLRADGRVRAGAVALAMARGPRVWRAMRCMQRDFNAACAGLRRAAGVLPLSWPA